MVVGKEILIKVRSVRNTQKIIKAMQMVSTSRVRKTQDRMRLARPYTEKVHTMMSHLAQTNADHGIKLLEPRREVHRTGFILITSDEGLCSDLNANVLKKFLTQVQEYQEQGIEVEVVCLGSKGLTACQSIGLNVITSTTNLDDTPKMEALLDPLTEIFQRHERHELGHIHIIYSRFTDTIRQEPRIEVLLPIGEDVTDDGTGRSSFTWEYLYEPSPVTVLEYLVRRYLESVVYQTLSGNMVSEQAARIVATKAATDNAGNAIRELRLVYNKSRQVTITTELSEIVAGATTVQCRLKPKQEIRIR